VGFVLQTARAAAPVQPLCRRIAGQLRDAIYRDDLAPGQRLASEQELMEQHGVSRNTIRLALGALTNEGLITSSQGRGSFVRDRAPLRFFASRTDSRERRKRSTRDAFQSDVAEQGHKGDLRIEARWFAPRRRPPRASSSTRAPPSSYAAESSTSTTSQGREQDARRDRDPRSARSRLTHRGKRGGRLVAPIRC
jgi:DNA-binding transcriptional regulator YhcF (GntR family)